MAFCREDGYVVPPSAYSQYKLVRLIYTRTLSSMYTPEMLLHDVAMGNLCISAETHAVEEALDCSRVVFLNLKNRQTNDVLGSRGQTKRPSSP